MSIPGNPLSGQCHFRLDIFEVEAVGDGLAGHFTLVHIQSRKQTHDQFRCERAVPPAPCRRAQGRRAGEVALLSAAALVCGTAPGILATQ